MRIEKIVFWMLLAAVVGRGWFPGLFVIGDFNDLALGQSSSEQVSSKTLPKGPIVIIKVDGTINPAVDDYLKTSFERAKADDARLLIIELNTPGGLLSSMESITKIILDSPLPCVVFVGPAGSRAVSAGMFITIAAHLAVMAPGTTIGAAHPVTSGGDNVQGDMRDKLENYASSLARSLAEQRGRNVEWAEKAVRESVAITDREALEKGVVNFLAADMDKVIAELDGRSVTVAGRTVTLENLSNVPRLYLEMSLKQKVINILADPNIAILLGFAAVLGIMMELYHPGTAVPGVIGVICLVLSLTASQVIPINYGGVALLGLGVAFVITELYVPSFGIWGVGGTICFILGAIYSIDTDLVWSADGYGVSRGFLAFVGFFVGGLFCLLAAYLRKHRRELQLTGAEALVGAPGQITKWAYDGQHQVWRGKVRVRGELWSARLVTSAGKSVGNDPSGDLAIGSKVYVVKMTSGMVLEVSKEGLMKYEG